MAQYLNFNSIREPRKERDSSQCIMVIPATVTNTPSPQSNAGVLSDCQQPPYGDSHIQTPSYGSIVSMCSKLSASNWQIGGDSVGRVCHIL